MVLLAGADALEPHGFSRYLRLITLMGFKLPALRDLMSFAGKKRSGNKKSLRERAVRLLDKRSIPFEFKILELASEVKVSDWDWVFEYETQSESQKKIDLHGVKFIRYFPV